jgi:hypothetical protein
MKAIQYEMIFYKNDDENDEEVRKFVISTLTDEQADSIAKKVCKDIGYDTYFVNKKLILPPLKGGE